MCSSDLLGLFFSIFVYPTECRAGSGCGWALSNWALSCHSGYFGRATGCIGLKNIYKQKVRVYVQDNDGHYQHRVFSKDQIRKASYKRYMGILVCEAKNSKGEWEKIKCYDAFDRTTNRTTGGGCGCNFFSCLPGS